MGAHSFNIKSQEDAEKRNGSVRKMNIVTGVRERSELEAMIERYLGLAHSALKEKSRPDEEDSAA